MRLLPDVPALACCCHGIRQHTSGPCRPGLGKCRGQSWRQAGGHVNRPVVRGKEGGAFGSNQSNMPNTVLRHVANSGCRYVQGQPLGGALRSIPNALMTDDRYCLDPVDIDVHHGEGPALGVGLGVEAAVWVRAAVRAARRRRRELVGIVGAGGAGGTEWAGSCGVHRPTCLAGSQAAPGDAHCRSQMHR